MSKKACPSASFGEGETVAWQEGGSFSINPLQIANSGEDYQQPLIFCRPCEYRIVVYSDETGEREFLGFFRAPFDYELTVSMYN